MNILRVIKRFFENWTKKKKMNNMRRRRESVISVYKKTTKFLTANTPNILKIMPNRKYRLLTKTVEEYEGNIGQKEDKNGYTSEEEEDFGERDLDYYLGVRKKEKYWRDPAGKEQIRKDFLLYHCGVTEGDYEKNYKISAPKVAYVVQPRLKQVPFKIHRKKKTQKGSLKDESWKEKRLFRLFAYRRDSEQSTSDSYSECDSSVERKDSNTDGKSSSADDANSNTEDEKGVRIKEVSEGRPCDNCPELCPGFIPHAWRKTCKSCGCDRLKHSVYHEELSSVRDRLGLRASQPQPLDTLPGLNAKETENFWQSLAEHAPAGIGGTGPSAWRAWRNRALATQLPKQDLSLAHCRHVDDVHCKQYEDFVAARNEIALDIGIGRQVFGKSLECIGCNKAIRSGNIAVEAPRLGEQAFFHPGCFSCSECEEPLVEFAYCALDGRLYCVRHYAERLKPRCHSCDELIFSGEYTKAMNKDWHSGHFCCWQCDESLTGQRYVLRDEHPYCIKCYESVFANGCEECNKTIGIDSKDLSYKDKHWHEACFLCAKCRVSLVDKQFGSKLDKIYCGNCYDAQFASRCDGCGEVFRAGTKKMEYKTRQWHEKCFCCVVCKNPIGTKSFIPREQEIYCAGCYEDKFATRCVKCNKIITQGGVTYKNEPWHRECFTCTNCNTSLAGQRFTSRDEKPYCADCFGELFAKRCTACTKPITGIGGTRFISFEDRHWHNDCFICAQCKTSLVGKGFITDGQDIICPECAKQKLIEKAILPVVANARDWCEFKTQDMGSDRLFDVTDNIKFRKVRPDPRT